MDLQSVIIVVVVQIVEIHVAICVHPWISAGTRTASEVGVTQEGMQGIHVTGPQPVVSDNVKWCMLLLKEIASCLSSAQALHLLPPEHVTGSGMPCVSSVWV